MKRKNGRNMVSYRLPLYDEIRWELHVDEKFLRTCGGASDKGWVKAQLEKMRMAECPVAIRWYASDRWKRCTGTVKEGQVYCARHSIKQKKRKPRTSQDAREIAGYRFLVSNLIGRPEGVQTSGQFEDWISVQMARRGINARA